MPEKFIFLSEVSEVWEYVVFDSLNLSEEETEDDEEKE